MLAVADVTRIGGVAVVRCSGELDLSVVAELAEALDRTIGTDPDAVVVDLSAVPFLDCCALRALLDAAARCERSATSFVLVGVGRLPRRIIDVLDLGSRLPTASTVPEALERLAGGRLVPATPACDPEHGDPPTDQGVRRA